LRIFVAGISVLVIIGSILSGGASYSATLGINGSRVSAQLSPFIVYIWPLSIIAIAIGWSLPQSGQGSERTNWWRRLLVFGIDFILYFIALGIPIFLLALWLESKQVGQFAWHFTRDYARASDAYIDWAFLVFFLLLWISFGIQLWAGRRSPGGIVAGVEVRLSKPKSFAYCMAFGIFKYYALILPFLAYCFNWGVEASAYNLETKNSPS
jgi:hypothetical protein